MSLIVRTVAGYAIMLFGYGLIILSRDSVKKPIIKKIKRAR